MTIFRKIAKYNLYPQSSDIYTHVVNVLLGIADPESLDPQSLHIESDILLISPYKRAREAVEYNENKTEYQELPDLREIPFDLRIKCDRNCFEKHGSNAVRKTFKELFIADKLSIPRQQIFDEIRNVLNICKAHEAAGKSVTVISHSFRLTLLRAYIESSGTIEKEPSLIHNFIKDEKKMMEFGESFSLDLH